MIEIIPAIMPRNLEDLADKVSSVKGFAKWVQVDVMDGVFVASRDWPYVGDGELEFERLASEAEELPYWKEVNYEADLMIENPERTLSSWIQAGFQRIIVHAESVNDISEVLRICDHLPADVLRQVGAAQADGDKSPKGNMFSHSIELGVAINIETSIEALEDWVSHVDFVQCMGIARIGYQGEPFDSRVLERISFLKEAYPDIIITVDGGVSFENASQLTKAGASRLVAGSAILGADSPKEAYQEFITIVNSHAP